MDLKKVCKELGIKHNEIEILNTTKKPFKNKFSIGVGKKRKTMITVGTDTLLRMAKQLMERGEITVKNYQEMEKRNSTTVPQEFKGDVIIVKK